MVKTKFNPKKVTLRVPEVSYVGRLFSAEGLKPDPEKIGTINEMPPPVDKEGVSGQRPPSKMAANFEAPSQSG